MESSQFIAASVGLGVLVFILLLSIVGIVYFRKYLTQINGSKASQKLGTYISPKEPPEFVIPPYTLIADESDGETLSDFGDLRTDEIGGKFTPPAFRRAISMPPPSDQSGNSKQETTEGHEETGASAVGIATAEYRPQYRRAVSQYAPYSTQIKREPVKKISIAPYGKLEVSVHFLTAKKVLFVQVNGAFDLPHVRLSGISTPYVRVHLLSGQRHKDTRSNFLNLGTNRKCMFDQMTLEEAHSSTLKFVVLDYDKFSRSEFVAEVMLSLLEVDLTEGTTLSLHLNYKTINESADRGTITLSVCHQPTANHLHVIVMKASGLPLPKSDALEGCDTYVKVLHSVQGKVIERKKTKVVKKSTSPVFNEAFVFDVREEDLRRSSISCEVHRGDTVLKTERIGHITLDLESFGTEVRQWNDMITSPLKRVTETHLLHA